MSERNLIDLDYQRQLLLDMRSALPRGIYVRPRTEEERDRAAANLRYLEGHGLCVSGVLAGSDGHIAFKESEITQAGIDFLDAKGGLSATLNVVVVKMHEDTIRALLAAKVDETPMPEEEKSAIRKHLATLPEAALRVVTTDLVQTGLRHLPDAAHWLRTLAGL
jgi:hypothetical protein